MLSAAQLQQFADQGFLLIPEVLVDADLQPLEAEYEDALSEAAAQLFQRGHIRSTYDDLPFDDRYMTILSESPSLFYYLGISLPLDYEGLDPNLVRAHTGQHLFGLLRHPKILDIVESVLGGEISSNPIQQVRLKPPQRLLTGTMADYSNVGATTWHQDLGAAMDEALDTELLTVWFAMTDASEEMGCLQVIPGSHKDSALSLHCPGKNNQAENYIPTSILQRHGINPVSLPCRRGSVVLLTKYTEHGALANESDRLRWSFDLRYQKTGEPTGRPAFPSFVWRSRSRPETEITDPRVYEKAWADTRQRVLSGEQTGPLYEQDRWLRNRDNPVCA